MDIETEERFAALEAQIQQLHMMLMMQQGENNGMLGEIVEPLPIASGGGGGNPKPFDYQTSVEGEGESARTVHWIVNNYFYWNGSLWHLYDFNCDQAVEEEGDHDIYLRCVWDDDNNAWAIDLGFQPKEQGSTNPCVYNFILYHFSNGTITRDYRDTFLSLGCRTIRSFGWKSYNTCGTGKDILIYSANDSCVDVKAETFNGDCNLTIGVYYV